MSTKNVLIEVKIDTLKQVIIEVNNMIETYESLREQEEAK